MLLVYLLKPFLYSFTSDASVFSTKQAVLTYYALTIYVVTESLVHHLELKQYQPVRILRANLVPSITIVLLSCPRPLTGGTFLFLIVTFAISQSRNLSCTHKNSLRNYFRSLPPSTR